MFKLKAASCSWAIKHLLKEGDTDLFPRPFEIEAIGCDPDETEKLLQKIDIGSYSWSGGRRTVVPKDMLSFRAATQLDPWDSLVLTSIIREFGHKIEQMRIPPSEDTVFSYRFHPMKSGRMYDREADWPSFWRKSKENAEIMGGWVAIADVNSYYNQIYHHTVENQLQFAGLPKEIIKSIIGLLQHLTQGVSRGIPVGPHSVHLLAECVFDPIDRSMLSRSYKFCRFVDDIHIFCKRKSDAQIALYDLADILDKQQKLGLQRHKTRILPADEFIEYAKTVLSEAPLTNAEKDIIAVITRHSHGDWYRRIQYRILSKEELNILSQKNLEELLNSYLSQNEPNFTRIRWLFRRLAQVGVPGAIPLAVTKIEQLSPALGDLGSYLLSSARYKFSGSWKHIGEDIVRALQLPLIQHSEYLTVTLVDLFAQHTPFEHLENILQMYPNSSPMVSRKIVRAATAHRAHYWLREQKESLPSTDPWLRRALIASASAFSKDERSYWLRRIEREGNDLEKLIVQWIKSER